ncbi:hypothetical protein [Streptomyces sp. NPDC056682]|uniref:hypothetical protein n=1 Tax=Streptomyces sp. NPDC056682 TaxID=3345909 RepID=UPI0036B80FBB
MVDGPVAERGVLTAPDELWDAAVRQAEVIGPLAETPVPLPNQPAAASADPSPTPPTRSSMRGC